MFFGYFLIGGFADINEILRIVLFFSFVIIELLIIFLIKKKGLGLKLLYEFLIFIFYLLLLDIVLRLFS